MKPAKEKAQELVDKYRTYIRAADKYEYLDPEDEVHLAKQCALVAVNEIINCDCFFKTLEDTKAFTNYWHEVQNELNKSE